jgi:hypothetical protein
MLIPVHVVPLAPVVVLVVTWPSTLPRTPGLVEPLAKVKLRLRRLALTLALPPQGRETRTAAPRTTNATLTIGAGLRSRTEAAGHSSATVTARRGERVSLSHPAHPVGEGRGEGECCLLN